MICWNRTNGVKEEIEGYFEWCGDEFVLRCTPWEWRRLTNENDCNRQDESYEGECNIWQSKRADSPRLYRS